MPAIITMFVPYHNVISTDLYCTIHAKISPLCHSERSGTTVQRRMLKPIIAAESNPEGAPAGGISALVYGIVQPLISNILNGLRTLRGRKP